MLISRLFQNVGRRQRPYSLDELRIIQTIAEQVVLATEQTFRVPGHQKKVIALRVAREMLSEQDLDVTDNTLDIAIEASVRLLKILERKGPDSGDPCARKGVQP